MSNYSRSIFYQALVAFCVAGFLQAPLQAQTTPSALEMVEQLKTQPPRTRSMRNLTIESAAPEGTVASKPSLSLLIQFDFNSAKVKPESQQALSNLAQALQSKELQDAKFAVEGHTDAKGRADYNLKLSQQRADAVRAYLASNGVQDSRLAAVGKGSTELANAADPQAAENRRVRIVNLN
jgi:outer membrane protein OmpA-like peptidoglycan-associated protein